MAKKSSKKRAKETMAVVAAFFEMCEQLGMREARQEIDRAMERRAAKEKKAKSPTSKNKKEKTGKKSSDSDGGKKG